MKIALVGEFSSLHKYLKEGLIQSGQEVILASSGDGYKKIGGADVELPVMRNPHSITERIAYARDISKIGKLLSGYDVVQLIYTNIFSPLNNSRAVKNIKKGNKMLSLVSAGSDYAYYRAYKTGKYKYHNYNYYTPPAYEKGIKGLFEKKTARKVEKMSDIIIPSLYDYTLGYETDKLYRVIPFPINVNDIEYRDNAIKGKIVFFHGLNREAKKGTPLIRAALEKLKDKYPNDVEVVIQGHMPFGEYMELMSKVNVVVDQTYGYGYGINSCLALAQGKIVVNPCKQEQIDAMGASFNPFVSVLPDVEDIYSKLCGIVENKESIQDMSIKGRHFVEEYHDSAKVAMQYLEAWKSVR